MEPRELAELLLEVAAICTLVGACGGVLVASFIRWAGERIDSAMERATRIVVARHRDHSKVPAIK